MEGEFQGTEKSLCFFSHREHFVASDSWTPAARHSYLEDIVLSAKQTQILLVHLKWSPAWQIDTTSATSDYIQENTSWAESS